MASHAVQPEVTASPAGWGYARIMTAVELVWDVDPDTWSEAKKELEAHGGLMVPTDHPVEVFQPVTVVVRLLGHERARVEGQAVQYAAGRAAVVFEAPSKTTLLAVQPGRPAGEALGKAEKIRLARQGNADARRKILRDPDQTLHPFLLTNPGLNANEVAGWFRSKLVPRTLIEQIAKRPELVGNAAVMEALVHDPRTPMPVALQLVPKLPVEVARRIAKQGRLRTQIVSAARKRVIG